MAQLRNKLAELQDAFIGRLQKQLQDQPTLIVSEWSTKLLLILALNHSRKTGKAFFFYSAVAAALAKSLQLENGKSKGSLPTLSFKLRPSVHAIEVETLALYVCVVACARKHLSLTSQAALAGLLSLLFQSPFIMNSSRYLWWKQEEEVSESESSLLRVPLSTFANAAARASMFAAVSLWLNAANFSLSNHFKTQSLWLSEYHSSVLVEGSRYLDQVRAGVRELPTVLQAVIVGTMVGPLTSSGLASIQLFLAESPSRFSSKSLKLLVASLVLVASDGLDQAAVLQRTTKEYITNYTTLVKIMKSTNSLFKFVSVGLGLQALIATFGQSENHRIDEDQCAMDASDSGSKSFKSISSTDYPTLNAAQCKDALEEIAAEIVTISQFMDKNHKRIMMMLDTILDAVAWEERAAQKLDYLREEGIAGNVIQEIENSNQNKVADLRIQVEEKIFHARKVQQRLGAQRSRLIALEESLKARLVDTSKHAEDVNKIYGSASTVFEKRTTSLSAAVAAIALYLAMYNRI